MAFSVMTLSVNEYQHCGIQHNETQNNNGVSFFIVWLIVIMQNVVMLNVVAPLLGQVLLKL
jgi:hypothetical protein